MPTFREVGPEARTRLVKPAGKPQVYQDVLTALRPERVLEVSCADGESVRALKVGVRRAANVLGLTNVRYGETPEQTLLVWLETTPARARRPRRSGQAEPVPETAEAIA